MQTGGNAGLWLKDANLQPPVFDPLLTRSSQPRLWLKDRARGRKEMSRWCCLHGQEQNYTRYDFLQERVFLNRMNNTVFLDEKIYFL